MSEENKEIIISREDARQMFGSGFWEVADMTWEEVEVEYKLIQEKKSKLSYQKRGWITYRYEFEVSRKENGDL